MREWNKESVPYGNTRKFTYVARCSECPATVTGYDHIGQRGASAALPQLFGAKGWAISTSPEHDLCPDCLARRASTLKKVVPMKPAPTNIAIVPDTMTRQDRQVIFQKLMDVYVDENVGYSMGWDDEKVATDLGVPRAWVAAVRDENFGPNKSEQVTKVLEEGQAILIEIKRVRDEIERCHKAVQNVWQEMPKLNMRWEKLEKELGLLSRKR